MRQEININIEELVLEGFKASDKYAIADALERELESLLREQGLTPGTHPSTLRMDRLNAGSITLHPGKRSTSFGSQLGRAIFASLKTSTAPAAPAETLPVKTKTARNSA
jgi:hypothetical protein